MTWFLSLGEFDFNIQYRKGYLKNQAALLSGLRTLGEIVVPFEEKVACQYLIIQTCKHETFKTDGLDNKLEVSTLLFLVTEPDAEPLIAPVIEE